MRKNDDTRVYAKCIYTIFHYKMKMVIAKKFNIKNKLQKITISLYINQKPSYFLYNYIFNYKDFIKLSIII